LIEENGAMLRAIGLLLVLSVSTPALAQVAGEIDPECRGSIQGLDGGRTVVIDFVESSFTKDDPAGEVHAVITAAQCDKTMAAPYIVIGESSNPDYEGCVYSLKAVPPGTPTLRGQRESCARAPNASFAGRWSGSQGASGPGTLRDGAILHAILTGNRIAIALSEVVMEAPNVSEELRSFARSMHRDHEQITAQINTIPIGKVDNPLSQQLLAALAGKKAQIQPGGPGTAINIKRYLESEVVFHTKFVSFFQMGFKGERADVKGLLIAAKVVFQGHRDHARSMSSGMASR
jgi:predicted outer membrane protein